MTSEELEREKTKSFELGHISQLEDTADELRDRAGEEFGHNDDRDGIKKAKWLKGLAQEFETRAEDKRDKWDSKYD